MGTELQSKMYMQGYYPLKDLDNNVGKGTWPLLQEQKTLRSGQYQDIFLTRPDMHRYEEYEKELLRQTILKHETIFRHQLHELHRLYKIQMDLMDHIRSKEQRKHLMLAGTLKSSNIFLSEDDKKRWHMATLSLMDSCYGRPSTLGVHTFPHFNSVKGTIMQSNFGPTQSIVKRKDHKPLEPRSSKLQRRFFDLEVPADEFISNDVEPQGVSELSRLHDHPSNRVNGIACKRDGNLSICVGVSTGYNTDASRSNMHSRETPRVDLNEITREEEASASAITGHKTNSKEEMNSSASAYSGFQLLAKKFSQNLRNGRDGAVSNLHCENECQQQDQLSSPFEAGSIVARLNSVHKLTDWDACLLRKIEVRILKVTKTKVQVIRWKKPKPDRLKLNSDGSSLGNPGHAGGGGILRDERGHIVFGFSKYFGPCSSTEVELRGVLEGVKLCKLHGYSAIDIECDSSVVVNWFCSKICTIWYLWEYWDQLQLLLQDFDYSIVHIYREGNQVADSLARRGALGETKTCFEWSHLPRLTRGLVRLDYLSTAYVRSRK